MSTEHWAFISLGSNIEPERYLPKSVQRLRELCRVERVSSVWESPAVGNDQQSNFCNAAVLIRTSLSPEILKFQVLRQLETDLGRIRDPANRNADRTIDLDLVLYDSTVLDSPEIQLPDPDIAHRAFLIVPLAELDAHYQHPTLHRSLDELRQQCDISTLRARPDIRIA